MRARLTALIAVAVLAMLPLAGQAQSPQFTWKTGTPVGPGNPMNDAMYELQKQLAEKSKGRVKL
jgi:TRAP-type C4-dicarboxylate transport system substrate-binding protein